MFHTSLLFILQRRYLVRSTHHSCGILLTILITQASDYLLNRLLGHLTSTCNSVIVVVYVCLQHIVICIDLLQFLSCQWAYFSDSVQHVLSHVLISILLEYFSWKWLFLILRCMDKVAEVSSLTSNWTVKVLAGNCSEVSNFYLLCCFYLLLSFLLLLCFVINFL